MPVSFTPPNATGKVVVAIHGGAYVGKATIFHSVDLHRYGPTGATVVVPDYTLSPAGTAETVVPVMTDYISQVIAQNDAANVSVIGDSSGGGLALLAIQELVRRNAAVPGHLVLLAPWLDVSMSDPRSAQINDPLLNRYRRRRRHRVRVRRDGAAPPASGDVNRRSAPAGPAAPPRRPPRSTSPRCWFSSSL